MADSMQMRLRRSPAIWRTYPGVLMRTRPQVTEAGTPPPITVSVSGLRLRERSVGNYARMCGFEDTGSVPITYPHVLAMPLHLHIFSRPAFPLRPMGLIHLSNTIESIRELRTGASLDVEVSARDYRRTDAGLAFDVVTEIRDQEGAPAWRESCCFLSRWPESAERPVARPPRPPKAPKDAVVLAEVPVTLRTAWAYARVSGDYNPIHLSERAARYFGLRGAIAHGMWSLARSLAAATGPVPASKSRLEAQFLTPVQLPARVAIKQWTHEGQVRRALCDVRTGRVQMYSWWVTP